MNSSNPDPIRIHGMSRREAERAVVGTLFLNGDRPMGIAIERGVDATWFTDHTCRQAWLAVNDLFASAKPIDVLTASTRLWDMHGEYAAEGARSMPDIDALTDHAPVEAHFEFTLGILESHVLCAIERRLLCTQGAIATDGDPQDVRDRIAAHAEAWSDLAAGRKEAVSLSEAALEWIKRIESPAESKPALIEWWLPGLTAKLGPLSDELVYLCALESVGKTAAAIQMAVCNARRGKRVAIRSLESSTARLIPRMIAHAAQVDRLKLERGRYTPDDLLNAKHAAAEIASLPIGVDDGGANVAQLRAWAMREKSRGASLLIVDNLRHVRHDAAPRGQNKAEQFSALSHAIKTIRDDVGLPLVMLHHLTESEHGADVSWSRDIRKDADILIFLAENKDECKLPSAENGWSGEWIIDVQVKKHRDGEKGYDTRTYFDKPVQTYREYGSSVAEDVGGAFARGE